MKYLFLILILFAAIYQYFLYQKGFVTPTLIINQTKFEIEIADSDAKREKGLSGRESLGENSGMLFLFPKTDYYNFWMNEMKIPLDFVWINGNKIIDITENVQAPSNKKDLELFSSKEPADKVLEINAGSIKKNRIKIGDTIQLIKN